MTTTWNAGAVARLFALGLAGGILQLTTVSQITVLGVPADLAPLLAASVGLLLGSVPGACFGFGLGLLMDTALAQTLGITSLVLLTAGYGAGRLRELRDPAHALVRRVLLPFLPDDPRRRRRRAYTTGGLSPLSRA